MYGFILTRKKSIPWKEVEKYLKRYIGDIVEVSETKEMIHIGSDFPDEFKGSEDTKNVRGANAKAKKGWYRYLTRFALSVITEENCISHYNVYLATLIVWVDIDGILNLYDVINVKKETSSPFEL